ncbi:MAG TPA: ABC transporter substrate-binding protein, partial [Anaerolineae bacterium]|nr:ABC transporter substrate-binding protein [Anaerolineae bacterium]
MKTLTRLFNAVFVVVLAFGLVACGSTATPTPTTPPATTEAPTQKPTEAATEAPTEAPTEAAPQPVTLRYANWNLGTEEENNIQRQL